MVNGPQTKLAFQNLQIENALRVEPEFHPDILEYDVYPIAGPADMSFSVVMNTPPTPTSGRMDVYDYKSYPDYSLYYKMGWETDRHRWYPSSEANPTEHKVIFTAATQYKRDISIFCEGATAEIETLKLVLHVHPRALAEGECGHFHSRNTEGEVWGGGSGSCQVEMLTICTDCGHTISRWIDHRD